MGVGWALAHYDFKELPVSRKEKPVLNTKNSGNCVNLWERNTITFKLGSTAWFRAFLNFLISHLNNHLGTIVFGTTWIIHLFKIISNLIGPYCVNTKLHSQKKKWPYSVKILSWNWIKSVRGFSIHASGGISAALWHVGRESGVRGGKTTSALTFQTPRLRNGLINPLKDKDGWRLKWNGRRGCEPNRWILLTVSFPNSKTYSDRLTAVRPATGNCKSPYKQKKLSMPNIWNIIYLYHSAVWSISQ